MIKYSIAFPILEEEEKKNILDCIESGWVSSRGRYIEKFEKLFADYCGTKYAVAVSNGTAALQLALLAADIKPGEEVIIPNLTFGATANAPMLLGIKPVLVDINKKTWNIDIGEIERNISKKTRAIMPVHLYGMPCEMDRIKKIAKKYNLKVIEDAAEAHGAVFKKRKAGNWSDVGCFSFFGNKIITTGEGGICTTNSKILYEKMLTIRNNGMDPNNRYWHDIVGCNFRMTNMQAALGVAQIKKLDKFISKKRQIAYWYMEEVKKQKVEGYYQREKKGMRSIWWMFTLILPKIDDMRKLISYLESRDMASRPIFFPLSTMPAFSKVRKSKTLKSSLELAGKGISLPTNLKLERKDVREVVNAIRLYTSK
jgi:perosamine synthetase